VERLPDGVLVVDAGGSILSANATAERMFGYPRGDLEGRSVEALVPARFHARHANERVRYCAAPRMRRMGTGMDLRGQRKDGTEFPVDISLGAVEVGGATQIICCVRDMTEYHELKAALARSEEQHRLLVENASEIFYAVRIDLDALHGTVTFMSRRVEEITGRTPDEFTRDPGLWVGSVHPDDLPAFSETTQRIVLTRRPGTRLYRFRHLSGEYRWIEDHVVPTVDAAATVTGYQGAARDVTERKQAELALSEVRDRLELAVAAANVGFWDWDLRMNAVYYSPQWKLQLGHGEDEIAGDIDEWRKRIHPDDAGRALEAIRASLAPPWPRYACDYRMRHKDGSYRRLLASGGVVTGGGFPVRLLGAHIDITDPVDR
jgi:PAS domain S-box-containing protein